MEVSAVKTDNLMHAMDLVAEAKRQNADVVILPECFNSPYGTSKVYWLIFIIINSVLITLLLEHFEPNAEEIPSGPSCKSLSEAAKTNNVHLIGGSIPERVIENGNAKLYNTSTVWSPEGNLIAKHQKVYKV